MTSPELTQTEAENLTKPWVQLRIRGYQPGAGSVRGRMLYNVVSGDYTAGSTVTVETMLERGFRVEVVA